MSASKFDKYIAPPLKYLAATIVPVFLGSFILAGALAKYANNDALNKTIIETAYKPSKEKFRECTRFHNRLVLAEQELSGSLSASADELQFIIDNGNNRLPEEYGLLVDGLMKQQGTLRDEIAKLRSDVPACYDVLYSQLEDFSLLLGVSDQLQPEFDKRRNGFNNLHKIRSEKALKALQPIDPEIIRDTFRRGLAFVAKDPEKFVSGSRHLAAQAQQLSEVDKQLFDLEQKTYTQINSITSKQLQTRLNKGIWAFLLG